MRRPLKKFRSPTEGERARALAYLLMAVSSAGLGYLAVVHLDSDALFAPLSWHQLWIIIAASLGGVSALFLSGDRMGQQGAGAGLRAAAAAIWVTFIASLVGGTLGLPIYGTMFGPFIVVVTFMGAPVLALLWLFNLLGIHILMGTYQRERDSIFAPDRMLPLDRPPVLRRGHQHPMV